MTPEITEDQHRAYYATPEFREACELKSAPMENARYIPPFTELQSASVRTVLNCLPQGIEWTARALFNELEATIRELRKSSESMEKDLVVAQQATEENTHNRVMRKKLCEFLKTVAFLVDEKFDPVTLPYPDREFHADRIICKLYRLLAPGNIKSWDVSGEPEKHSAEWYRQQSQSSQPTVVIPVTEADSITDDTLAGVDYEELRELRFQNAELSRQLEKAKASEKQFRDELGLINNAIQPFREELFAAELTHVSIDYIVSRLVFAWNKYKAETFNATRAADIQAVQKERDELGAQLSDIKLVLARHLSDDPLFNVVPVAEIIDQKLGHLQAVSQEAHRLQMQEAKITLQAIRLSDAGIVSQVGADLAGMVQNLVAFRLGSEAAQKQKDAKDSSSSSEASSAIAPKAVVHAPGSDAVMQDKRSPFVKVAGHIQFRTDNPGIDWVKVGDFDIPVPLVKSAIMMAGGSKMPDGQPLHLSMVSQQLSLLPDAGTAIGRCFGGTIGKLRDGAATSGDVDEAIAKRLEKHRVVWPSSESA